MSKGGHTKTFVDNYRTPHSEKLHVIERYRLVDDGRTLQADVTIEDSATFIKPLQVIHRWRRAQGPMRESSCAEENSSIPSSRTSSRCRWRIGRISEAFPGVA